MNIWFKVGGRWEQAGRIVFSSIAEDGDEYGSMFTDDEVENISSVYRSNDGECLHEHLTCPEGIESLKCAYCNKPMYKSLSD